MNGTHTGLNGGESVSRDWTPEPIPAPRQAVRCELDLYIDEAIEFLSLIDQPAYFYEEYAS